MQEEKSKVMIALDYIIDHPLKDIDNVVEIQIWQNYYQIVCDALLK